MRFLAACLGLFLSLGPISSANAQSWNDVRPIGGRYLIRWVTHRCLVYGFGMKRDGRLLDHRTLEEIRKMALERVREGEKPSAVIGSYGFHRSVIYRWMNAAKGRGKGLRALASRKGTGRPRKLTAAQERQVFRWINGKNPLQYGFDFGLWTRQIVRELVERKFSVRLSLASIGGILARLGLSAQKPLQRAYQRDPEAIERWRRENLSGYCAARQAGESGYIFLG